ncbi:MAG TPA: allophanate hydrolase [Bryobacteraceae bacterium]|nr:allophanate hydrolase [Bryobacteraceae bacterium]
MKAPVWISAIPEKPAREGPLKGLTFAIKDNIDYAGVPTTAGCPAFAKTPEKSAAVVTLFEESGARAVGKTNLDQFATGLVGVRSPYGACSSVFHPEYISGGSSSGSAVAVASGQVDFSLGTDTAGSGRVPAAFNNIVGLKPSKGVLSNEGVVPACASLDCVSIFTRDIATAQRVLAAANPRPAQSPAWANGPFRFGAPRADQLQFFGDDAAAALYGEAIAKLEAAGGTRVEIDYTPFRDAAQLLYAGPWVAERYVAVGAFLEDHGGDAHPVVRDIILGGKKYTAADTFRAMYKLEELRRQSLPTWQAIDVMLLPTTGTIYKISEVEADPVKLNSNLGYYTNFVNLLDLAALAIPAGFRPNGLPFGVTLIAPNGTDWALLDLGARLEEIRVTVVGAHLTGQPLNRQLTERGARLIKTAKTAPDYRLYALANTVPPKPGLVREPGYQGPGIEVEVWGMPARHFGSFVALIPKPLGIGSLQLDDGTTACGFICEPAGLTDAVEITHLGGWRNYLANR